MTDSEKVHVSGHVFYSEKSAIIIRNYLCFVVTTPFILIEVEDMAPRLRTACISSTDNQLDDLRMRIVTRRALAFGAAASLVVSETRLLKLMLFVLHSITSRIADQKNNWHKNCNQIIGKSLQMSDRRQLDWDSPGRPVKRSTLIAVLCNE